MTFGRVTTEMLRKKDPKAAEKEMKEVRCGDIGKTYENIYIASRTKYFSINIIHPFFLL